MCGIFALQVTAQDNTINLKAVVTRILKGAERRGKDTSGIAVAIGGDVSVIRCDSQASVLLKSRELKSLITRAQNELESGVPILIIGHTRMATHGGLNSIQPIENDKYLAAHNGIFLSTAAENSEKSDTQSYFDKLTCQCSSGIVPLMGKSHIRDAGANSVIWLELGNSTWGFESNNSNLFAIYEDSFIAVASEPNLLRGLVNQDSKIKCPLDPQVYSLPAGRFEISSRVSIAVRRNTPTDQASFSRWDGNVEKIAIMIKELIQNGQHRVGNRCKKCILPDTFPGITFDHDGICSECSSHSERTPLGDTALAQLLASQPSDSPILIPVSGGRDSSFALASVSKLTNRKIITFTYDWGFVTDLARRNISAICGSLGVENILVAADIGAERTNVRKNLVAWCRKPTLAIIPLMMSGDKAFFPWASKVANQRNATPIIFSMNWLEKTNFKVGFAAKHRKSKGEKLHSISTLSKVLLIVAYIREFIRNPKLINSSLPRTAMAFVHFYLRKKDYIQLFDYLVWNQELLEQRISELGWTGSESRTSTWRVGDATSSFYNVAYLSGAGFSEHDTFLSNQIREGTLTRPTALGSAESMNQPDVRGFIEYCKLIDLDPSYLVEGIQKLP